MKSRDGTYNIGVPGGRLHKIVIAVLDEAQVLI